MIPRGSHRWAVAVPGAEAHVFRRISDISAAEWDAVVPPDELQSTHAFVRTCQESGVEDAAYWHVAVYREGRLAGVASVMSMRARLDLLASGVLRRGIEEVRRVRPGFMRPALLFCGLPVSAGRSCLVFHRPEDAHFVTAAVARVMERVSQGTGVRLLCFKEFTEAEVRLVDGLRRHGYFRAHSLPSFRMDVRWASFDAYLAGMRAGYRRQLLATLRARREQRLTVRHVSDVAPECGRFFDLYGQVMDRARFQLERLNLSFFERLCANFAGRIGAVLVERDGELAAAALLLRSNARLTFFMAGLDYAINRGCTAYHNLMAEIVAEAIRSGVGELELGQTSPALKLRLGAVAEPRYLYFRCRPAPVHATFRQAARALFREPPTPRRRVFC